MNYSSRAEQDIFEYINSFYTGEIKNNVRNVINGELDIFLPELNMAFEFNGTLYHSNAFLCLTKGLNAEEYHEQKMNRCKENNIELFYIWEDDWNKQREKIKSDIKNIIFQKPYNKELFSRVTNDLCYPQGAIFKMAGNNIPKIDKYFPELTLNDAQKLTKTEKQAFKKASFSYRKLQKSEPLNKDELLEKYDKVVLNQLYKKGFFVKDDNGNLIIPAKYMTKVKSYNKYKVPSEYFAPSKTPTKRTIKKVTLVLITEKENVSKVLDYLKNNRIDILTVQNNVITCKVHGTVTNYNASFFKECSKNSFIALFTSRENRDKRFSKLYVNEEEM